MLDYEVRILKFSSWHMKPIDSDVSTRVVFGGLCVYDVPRFMILKFS